jgi:hypothetical protein
VLKRQKLDKKKVAVERLALVDVKLKPNDQGVVESLGGVALKLVEGCFVVESIQEGGVAFKTAQVDEDYVLISVNGKVPTDLLSLQGNIVAEVNEKGISQDVVAVFRRPTPPIPVRGYARRGFQKGLQFKLNDEQTEWLQKQYDKSYAAGTRAAGYHTLMKTEFQYTIREDVDQPFWLPEPTISEWLKDKKSKMKLEKKIKQIEKSKEAKKKKEETTKKAKSKKKPETKKKRKRGPQESIEDEDEEETEAEEEEEEVEDDDEYEF